MALFKKKSKKSEVAMTTAPEEPETAEEIKHIEELSSTDESADVSTETTQEPTVDKELLEYKEIPVCLSQAQINNMIIENNIMLKQIMTELD